MSLFNSFWNYRINVCRLLTTVERHICIQLSVCSLKLLQWNLWTSLSLICSLSVFPRSLTLSNSDTVQMKSGSRRWRMHGLTVRLHSETSTRTESVTEQRTPLGIDQPSPWQLFTGKCAHLPHCESTQNASGLVSTWPLCFLQKTHKRKFRWATGPGEVLHKHTHTCTHSDRTNETWKPKIAACYAFGIFFVFLNLYSNRQAEHIPRRNCIRSDSLGSRRSPFFKLMLYIFINVFTKDKCKDVRSCQDWGASAKYWTRRRWLQQ